MSAEGYKVLIVSLTAILTIFTTLVVLLIGLNGYRKGEKTIGTLIKEVGGYALAAFFASWKAFELVLNSGVAR